jgi:hypothetical protein
MPAWQGAVDDWFSTHHGVIGARQLELLGVSARTVSRMVSRQQLIPVLPGVFRSRQWPPSDTQLMVAVCARNPLAAIGLTTACRLWSFRRVPADGLHVLVPHGSSPVLSGFEVHRCRRIDPVDVVERPDGIRLTSPPRSIFDASELLGYSATRSIVEQIVNENICTIGTIADTVARLAHANRPGTRTMLRVLASRPMWAAALQSDLELRILEEIERQGLPRPTRQCPLILADRSTIHFDFGWPEHRVGLEVDHPAWHDGQLDRQRDGRRDRAAAMQGWVVPRVAKLEVDWSLSAAIAEVGVILRGRGWRG